MSAAPAAATLSTVLVQSLAGVPGLRPATPLTTRTAALVSWNLDGLAVELGPDVVEVRLVGLTLPLLPALRRAETVLRSALRATPWENATLRLVVTDLDASALAAKRDEDHPFGA